jgi:hypothetical protein
MSDDLIIPNIAIAEPPIVHDMATDITEKVKADMLNLAQTLHCGGCHNTLNFGGEGMKAYEIKGRKFPDGEAAFGILCEDCQRFENKVEEGPLLAIRFEGAEGQQTAREYPVNNLPIDQTQEELAVTASGTLVKRDSSTGRLTKVGEPTEAALEATRSMPEKEAKTASRREK